MATEKYNLITYEPNSTDEFGNLIINVMSGSNSNMTKIDAALGDKAEQSQAVDAVLLSSAWAGAASPYTQTLSIEGLTATQNGEIAIAMTATATQRDVARRALLSVTGQANGTLTISADGELPITDIPVTIVKIG